MSLLIDETTLQRFAEQNKVPVTYTVTALNSVEASDNQVSGGIRIPYPSLSVTSTVPLALPSMSSETVERLLSIRQQIVDSGNHLMSTTELDDEIAKRKRGL